jgi:hypothetical protein
MMDPKLAAILKKAKAVDSATAQKNGEVRKPTRQATVNRGYFDEPEVEYLHEGQVPNNVTPSKGGSGGLFDQMGVSSGGGSGPTTPTVVDRMDVNSSSYTTSVESSNLPPAIMKAMLDSPIPMGDTMGGTGVSEEFIREINPNMGRTQVPELPPIQEQYDSYDEEDEGDYYSHPIQEQPRAREIPRTQPRQVVEHTEVGESEIRRMIAQEIAKALPVVIEQYFDKRVLKENVSFKAGDTTFSGTVSPLPKKRTKKRT